MIWQSGIKDSLIQFLSTRWHYQMTVNAYDWDKMKEAKDTSAEEEIIWNGQPDFLQQIAVQRLDHWWRKKGRFWNWGYFILLMSFMTDLQKKCLCFYYLEVQYTFKPMFICCLYVYSLPLILSIFRNSCLYKFQCLPLWKMEPLLEQNVAAV